MRNGNGGKTGLKETKVHINAHRRKTRQGPYLQCGSCDHVIKAEVYNGSLKPLRHHPNSGDLVGFENIACIGATLPDQATIVLSY